MIYVFQSDKLYHTKQDIMQNCMRMDYIANDWFNIANYIGFVEHTTVKLGHNFYRTSYDGGTKFIYHFEW